jgi:hypothetical protein
MSDDPRYLIITSNDVRFADDHQGKAREIGLAR